MPSEKTKGLGQFHESFYEHSCTVQEGKKDVLKTDIKGNVYSVSFKRWWHGLFLVSYNDERARLYYKSSEAMRLNRIRQYRFFRGRIHPLSKFRSFWDGFILILLIVNKFMVHHNLSILYCKVCYYFYFIGPSIEIFVIIDIIINIKTGYIDHEARKIIIEKEEGIIHYCSTKLFFHVASAIPIQCILLLRYGANVDCDLCKTNYFVLVLRAVAVFGLLRIIECSSHWNREWKSFEVTSAFRFLRVFTMGLLTLLYIQDMASKAALMIMINNGEIIENSFWSQYLYKRFIIPNPLPSYTLFLLSILRATNSAFRMNFSSILYHIDRCVIIVSYIIVSAFYIWGLSEVFRFVNRKFFCEKHLYKLRISADNMIRCRQFPDHLREKVYKYYESKNVRMKLIEQNNKLYVSMPQILKDESMLVTNRRFVERIPYFSDWPPEVVEAIVLLLKEEVYLENDMVAESGVSSDGLSVVGAGELAVYSGEEEREHLVQGDYFGELSLVTDHEIRTTSIVAISCCVILLLDKIDFRKYMRSRPNLFLDLETQLKNNSESQQS